MARKTALTRARLIRCLTVIALAESGAISFCADLSLQTVTAPAHSVSPPSDTATPLVQTAAPTVSTEPEPAGQLPTSHTYRIIQMFPHDRGAFTQGLAFESGFLYEGTGLNGQSSLRKVNLETGEVVQIVRLSEEYFGEGIAIFAGRIVQLTLNSGGGFVYDQQNFTRLGQFSYSGEGWGITHDDTRYFMSDGTATLRLLDTETFQEIGRLTVRDGGQPVVWLNELEHVNGEIYANVWQSDRIARISPETGRVLGWIDLTGLLGVEDSPGVLNGIAYDAEQDRLFVTGKNWPWVFEIELVAAPER